MREELDEAVSGHLPRGCDRSDAPGWAIAVIQDGTAAFEQCCGMASLEHDLPITPDTLFRIASITKPFTCAAILLLADRGALRLDDDVRKYLPRMPDFGSIVTIEHLMRHVSGWHEKLAVLVRPLVDAMFADARGAPYLCTDATGVLVQAKEKCRVGHFWVLVAPGKHVLYRYSAKHDGAAVDALLAGYQGYLVADAHAVYDHLFVNGKVVEVACWAHARRYWFKALDSEPERARVALGLIGELFRIERAAGDLPARERLALRGRESWPVVEKFFAWCKVEAPRALDDTPIAKAIGYALNQRAALGRFLEDGRLPLHNNGSEQALRREVIGRKNWLFVGNDDAAEVNAAFVSLLASCRMHSVEPWAYLRDLFCLLPSWPAKRVLDLAPVSWRQTREQQETQQRLAANPFRRAALDLAKHPDSK